MFEICKLMFKLQFLLIFLAIITGYFYPHIKEKFELNSRVQDTASRQLHISQDHGRLFTKKQLGEYNGEAGDGQIYLAILGSVYDVTQGKKHYGSGCEYNYFVGRDASVSFITGNFKQYDEDKADDVLQLKDSELLSLENWREFYEKQYEKKGRLIGRFYDSQGSYTPYWYQYKARLEHAKNKKEAWAKLQSKYPDCNIEWSAERGTRVWCTVNSGGRERDWLGFPRKLYERGGDNFRCACVPEENITIKEIMIKLYDDCDRLAHECFYKVD